MGIYAIVDDGIVTRVVTTDHIGYMFGKGMLNKVYECSSDVKVGWLHDGSDFSAPPLDDIKAEKRLEVKDEAKRLMAIEIPYDDLLFAIKNYLPQELQDKIQPYYLAGQEANQAINNATTQDEVESVTPVWPE